MAATTSSACSGESTGLIGSARFVRAASSVAGRSAPAPHSAHRGLAVHRNPVVAAVADARLLQRARERVGGGVAHDVQMPGGVTSPRPAAGA